MNFHARLGALLCFVLLWTSGASIGAAPVPPSEKHFVCPPCAQDCDTKVYAEPGVCPACHMALVEATTPLRQKAKVEEVAHGYVCSPCDAPCDTKVYDHPGQCPTCGMPLVEAGSEAAHPHRKRVAILVFNGVEIIDFTGPYEMFGAAGFEVYTVAGAKGSVTSSMGLTVVPKYTFSDAPQPDVLVIPGGGVGEASVDGPTIQYIKDATAHTQNTMSVCNGSFILAHTGMLDGLQATTTRGNLPRLASQFPSIKVIGNQRYTDNGKIITTGGLSAGIDGALHVIEKLLGTEAARKVAMLEEYSWQPGTKLPASMSAQNPLSRKDHGVAVIYTCPMKEHPKEFRKPGKCALCGMELEIRKG
ncbi:DJ-1/PfpI family protein [Geothrix sp. 21YS21S-2]|uniref:DJ-1/PfpI family protein n=1 Tax=Geothrix sp. 21YS21S-2 TaxID=3068893 RepID=UPI0027BAA3E5|nr:DJ-1/PfpI family protein [Geothrix sp. 21YS21S-2]